MTRLVYFPSEERASGLFWELATAIRLGDPVLMLTSHETLTWGECCPGSQLEPMISSAWVYKTGCFSSMTSFGIQNRPLASFPVSYSIETTPSLSVGIRMQRASWNFDLMISYS